MTMRHAFYDFIELYDAENRQEEIVALSLNSTALIVQCAIGFTTIYKMKQNPGINSGANMCFILSFISAIANTSAHVVFSAWDPPDQRYNKVHSIVFCIYFAALYIFYWSLLLTFIVRLYVIFKPSAYRMSTKLIVMFSVIMTLNLLCGGALLAIDGVFYQYDDILSSLWPIVVTGAITWTLSYFIGCVLAVYFFISNLSKLVASTPCDADIESSAHIQLDERQQQLSDLSAKYAMLFGFAIVSTILYKIIDLIVRRFTLSLFTVDSCINLWCLYLQFSFAQHQYNWCCGCCDKWSRKHTHQRARKLIYKVSTSAPATEKSSISSNSSNFGRDDESTPLDGESHYFIESEEV